MSLILQKLKAIEKESIDGDGTHDANALARDRQVHDNLGQQGDCGCQYHSCAICQGDVLPKSDVCCISIGSYCGVAQCLRGMQIRSVAYPFDWNRVSLEGVVHFLQTDFEDFLQWEYTKDSSVQDGDNGERGFCGKYHSFWHDDLTKQEDIQKYERRISRFLKNSEKKLLFIRACNSSAEVAHAEMLLQLLQNKFPESKVWLLFIVDVQSAAKSYKVENTNGRLLIHLNDKQYNGSPKYFNDVLAYNQAILFALNEARRSPESVSSDGCTGLVKSCLSVEKLHDELLKFYCGDPTCETWTAMPVQETCPINFPSGLADKPKQCGYPGGICSVA